MSFVNKALSTGAISAWTVGRGAGAAVATPPEDGKNRGNAVSAHARTKAPGVSNSVVARLHSFGYLKTLDHREAIEDETPQRLRHRSYYSNWRPVLLRYRASLVSNGSLARSRWLLLAGKCKPGEMAHLSRGS